jgi:hypothetical protein
MAFQEYPFNDAPILLLSKKKNHVLVFYFLVVLELELRALCLLDRHSNT